jgi:hypothetical protein
MEHPLAENYPPLDVSTKRGHDQVDPKRPYAHAKSGLRDRTIMGNFSRVELSHTRNQYPFQHLLRLRNIRGRCGHLWSDGRFASGVFFLFVELILMIIQLKVAAHLVPRLHSVIESVLLAVELIRSLACQIDRLVVSFDSPVVGVDRRLMSTAKPLANLG